MSNEALFLEFQQKWTKEKIQNMTLEEYTGIGGAKNNRDDFTYQLEFKIHEESSIKGGEAYKFGLYKYKTKPNEKPLPKYHNVTPKFDDKYTWLPDYGNTAQEAFKNIKNLILQVIEFSKNNQLEEIDRINLPNIYKWKIAFHYQKVDDMKILPIFKEEAVKQIYKNEFGLELENISEFHRKILPSDQTFTLEQVFEQGKKYWQKDENGIDDKTVKRESKGINMEQNFPLNQILYGPPGTGKTYYTIVKAMEIIDNKKYEDILKKEKYNDLKKRFDDLKQNGQIEFVTFHQSYGYEEFVEGIKPVFDDESGQTNEIKYEIRRGIFKEICESALENLENSHKSIEQLKTEYDLENIWNKFIANLNNELIEKDKVEFYGTMNINRTSKTSIFLSATGSEQSLSKEMFLRNYNKFIKGKIKNPNDIKPFEKSETKSHHSNAIYYLELFKQISEFEKKKSLKRYILIIDEINRGNISKIFGELITLIEKSKRVGNSEELKVKLPYSGKLFGVPRNLYIIGTMNTADRSIALLDTALRRRFAFVEMMPDAEILKDKNIDGVVNLQELLVAINERIEYLLDREHTIGHAYFIGVNDLNDLKKAFQNKIIPLLQEYFYDDYEKIRAVLNDTDGKFIQKIEKKDLEYNIKGFDDLFDSEKYIYKICKFNDLTADDFKKIYGVKEQNNSNE